MKSYRVEYINNHGYIIVKIIEADSIDEAIEICEELYDCITVVNVICK